MFEAPAPLHLPPQEVAPETFLLRSFQPAFGGAPMSVAINSLVIRGAQPVVIDTSIPSNRDAWFRDLESLLDPEDIRWIIISHDDIDHVGNLTQLLDRTPQATVVTSWIQNERMGGEVALPPDRMRWVDDGGVLDIGDRVLQALRPAVYDSPTTRGFFDPTTGVYWASDTFAAPMPGQGVERVDDMPADMWAEGMAMFHHYGLAPWLSMVNRDAYAREVARLEALNPRVLVSAHTPLIAGSAVATALRQLATLPDVKPGPHPDQNMLEMIIAGAAAPPAEAAPATA